MRAAGDVLDTLDRALRSAHGNDPYSSVRGHTDVHRGTHGCWAYPFDDGRLLGAIASAVAPDNVLELGTALGYTACWWTTGSPRTHVDTVELDPIHVRMARENFIAAGIAQQVTVLPGDFVDVLPTLTPKYDLAFFDGYAPTAEIFELISYLVRPGGVLITSNLNLGGNEFRHTLASNPEWQTRYTLDTGLSVRTMDPA